MTQLSLAVLSTSPELPMLLLAEKQGSVETASEAQAYFTSSVGILVMSANPTNLQVSLCAVAHY